LEPHASVPAPGWQVSNASQHPLLQVVGLQVAFGGGPQDTNSNSDKARMRIGPSSPAEACACKALDALS
jgi:hypothetical protein